VKVHWACNVAFDLMRDLGLCRDSAEFSVRVLNARPSYLDQLIKRQGRMGRMALDNLTSAMTVLAEEIASIRPRPVWATSVLATIDYVTAELAAAAAKAIRRAGDKPMPDRSRGFVQSPSLPDPAAEVR
jgi:hypothetical protein